MSKFKAGDKVEFRQHKDSVIKLGEIDYYYCYADGSDFWYGVRDEQGKCYTISADRDDLIGAVGTLEAAHAPRATDATVVTTRYAIVAKAKGFIVIDTRHMWYLTKQAKLGKKGRRLDWYTTQRSSSLFATRLEAEQALADYQKQEVQA